MLYLVWVVLVGILAGWLAGQITKGRGFGLPWRSHRGDPGFTAGQLSVWIDRNLRLWVARPSDHGCHWRHRLAVADPVDQESVGQHL